MADRLNTKWTQVELGNYHNYFDEWYNLYGVSTHAHGMYQIEFYKKILKIIPGNNPLLSGIVGDAWAGSIKYCPINCPNDLIKLGYTHGMNADKKQSLLKSNDRLKNDFYLKNKNNINDPVYQIVWIIRFKIILLSYLLKVPRSLGLMPWSPFLDIDVAMSMLTLNQERRNNRLWQKEYFESINLDFESMNIKCSKSNTLNYQAINRIKLNPLDINLLNEVIDKDYIKWINSNVCNISLTNQFKEFILHKQKIGPLAKYMGLKDSVLTAYFAYLTLKPIEQILKDREKYKHVI